MSASPASPQSNVPCPKFTSQDAITRPVLSIDTANVLIDGRSLTNGWKGSPLHHRSCSDSSINSSSTISSPSLVTSADGSSHPTPRARSALSSSSTSRIPPWLHTASAYSHLFDDMTQEVYPKQVRPLIAQPPRAHDATTKNNE